MPSPFPGFDPYLENPDFWRGFHNNFITFINQALNEILPEGFAASAEERVYLVQPERLIYPDVALLNRPPEFPLSTGSGNGGVAVATVQEDPPFRLTLMAETINEPYIEILSLGAEESVVTIIEVLSPTNKTHDGYGRNSYMRKQEQILQSAVHLLEIDLLREGLHTVAVPHAALIAEGRSWDYLVSLHRGTRTLDFEYWTVSLPSRLPRVRIPLTAGVPDVILDLQSCFDRTYDAGPYRRRVDYRVPPVPHCRWKANVGPTDCSKKRDFVASLCDSNS